MVSLINVTLPPQGFIDKQQETRYEMTVQGPTAAPGDFTGRMREKKDQEHAAKLAERSALTTLSGLTASTADDTVVNLTDDPVSPDELASVGATKEKRMTPKEELKAKAADLGIDVKSHWTMEHIQKEIDEAEAELALNTPVDPGVPEFAKDDEDDEDAELEELFALMVDPDPDPEPEPAEPEHPQKLVDVLADFDPDPEPEPEPAPVPADTAEQTEMVRATVDFHATLGAGNHVEFTQGQAYKLPSWQAEHLREKGLVQ